MMAVKKKDRFKSWVNRQVAKKLDSVPFSSLPLVMRIGLLILTLSFVIGYGGPLLAVVISGLNRKIGAGLLTGTLLYGISWVLGLAGLAMAGRDSIQYPPYFFAKLVKRLFPDRFRTPRTPPARKKKKSRPRS